MKLRKVIPTSTDNNDFYSILTTMRLFDKYAYLI